VLELAIKIAVKAHQKQVDKAGEPYILHPLRLMFKFTDEDLRVVAVLHDVIEDSEITEQNLIELGFKSEIVEALSNLTKIDGESYDAFIERAASNSLSRKVKIEDIKDNLNLERLERLNDVDLKRVEKYHRALKRLLSIGD
jgi:(p)ppGpp synthase/HD superfamily hydrolase